MIVKIILIILIFTLTSCANHIADTCESRTVAAAIRFKAHNIPHRIAVGNRHVAIQILKKGQWQFVYMQDAKMCEYTEYITLQRYLQYLIIYYDTLEGL